MTKGKKIEVLTEMKRKIKKDSLVYDGLCLLYYYITSFYPSQANLKQLGLIKPSKPYGLSYWFRPYAVAPRLRLINDALKNLSK